MATEFLIQWCEVLVAQPHIEGEIWPQLDVVLPEAGIIVLTVVFVYIGRSARQRINIDTFVDGRAIHKVPKSMGNVHGTRGSKFVVVAILV